MQDQALNLIRRSMETQLARKQYPVGFPVLPEVPAARYFDPDFAAAEMRYIWKKTWLLAGVESDLPQTGSYFLFKQLGQSIIVCRGNDGTIRAFHNICRHRASALLLEPSGRVPRFVCPYHAWGYALDGKLVSVPRAHDFDRLDKSQRGLAPIRCETWRGLIYINLDPIAGPLADFMLPAAAHTDGFPLANLVTKDHFFIKMDCNWKLAYHNFFEIYHVAVVHPTSLSPSVDSDSFVALLLDNGHARIAVRKRKGSSIFKAKLTVPDNIGEIFQQCTVVMQIFPNIDIGLDPSGFALQTFWPMGPDKSILEVRLVGWESYSPAEPDYWSTLRATMETILSEDLSLFASIQQGVQSCFMPKLLMGYQERTLYWFEEELDRRIGAQNIPEAMRVTPVLANQVGL
jgi:phenylpropionate dioxygenase-like ring-hydroxylating dioxygenase large terminal subunit